MGVQKAKLLYSPHWSFPHHFLAPSSPLFYLLPYLLYLPDKLHIYFFGYLSIAISNSQNVNCMWAGTLSLFTDGSPHLRILPGPEKALDKYLLKAGLPEEVAFALNFNQ